MFLTLTKHFRGIFWPHSGCFWVDFWSFLGQKPQFSQFQPNFFLDGYRAFLAISGPKIRSKTCQRMVLNHQKYFGGCYDYFQGVFRSIFGRFWAKIPVFPISAKFFLDRFRAFLGISSPKIRLKTCKNTLNVAKIPP